MVKAILYCRVSTDKQELSPEAQAAACRVWAERSAVAVAAVHTDTDISGSKGLEDRPALLAAISELGAGDILLVAKRDRLARGDVLLMAMIEAAVARKKARIVSAAGEGTESDDPSAILMRRMVDAFAEYERMIIRARTKAAMKVKKARGELVGKVPWGSRLQADGVHLEPDPREAELVATAKELKAAGYTGGEIRRLLNEKGFRNREGRPLHPQSIANILGG